MDRRQRKQRLILKKQRKKHKKYLLVYCIHDTIAVKLKMNNGMINFINGCLAYIESKEGNG